MSLNPTNDRPGELRRADLDPDPIGQFQKWLQAAIDAGLPEPTAMTLATATPDGAPSARIVLMKKCDAEGFTFFTNYESHKGGELAANPRVALVFHWVTLERQVRIAGRVAKVSRAESEEYFHSRPAGSQLGAWVSQQSRVVPGRAELERGLAEVTAKFAGAEVPLPPYWGGYRVAPERIEFWQGRKDRLHDRFLYSVPPGGGWKIERLSP
jgi:pyridoxamine 5'-phosphate oxidase